MFRVVCVAILGCRRTRNLHTIEVSQVLLIGADVEHDLVIIGMHVENIGPVCHRFRPYLDGEGKEVIYAKPYFSLEHGELKLHHIPVPKAPMTKATISPEDAPHVDWGVPFAGLRNVVKKLGMRDLMQKITKFQPVPAYDNPDSE
jgi:carbamoyltransferase